MTNLKKLFTSLLCLFVVLVFMTLFFPKMSQTAFADEQSDYEETQIIQTSDVEPRLWATLSISIDGGNGKVWATVRNDFTLFPSTVYVIVQLFSSSTYQENYENMEYVAGNSTLDLDMGKTITAEAPTNGEQKYWIGRMRFKEGDGPWKETVVGPGLFNGNGEFIGIL